MPRNYTSTCTGNRTLQFTYNNKYCSLCPGHKTCMYISLKKGSTLFYVVHFNTYPKAHVSSTVKIVVMRVRVTRVACVYLLFPYAVCSDMYD